jgi:hypothetical protein
MPVSKIIIITAACSSLLITSYGSLAEPIYHPSGPALTFGGSGHRSLSVSDMGNPAHPATDATDRWSVGLSTGLGLEYDGNDNLFRLFDELSDDPAIESGDTGASSSGGDATVDDPGVPGPIITDLDNPELEALAAEIGEKAVALAAFLALATTGLNAKAFVSADLPVLISNDSLGGAWTFDINSSLTTRVRGLNDPIEFDADAALNALSDAYDATQLKSATEPVTYDLTGGLLVTVDPDTGETSYKFENNSGVITRAAQITEFSLGYSREIWRKQDNKVTAGVRPRFINAGLSNALVFVENIENTRTLFDSLDKSNFNYSTDVGLDLGVAYTGKRYQLGATIINLNEPDFQFPSTDVTGIDNPDLIAAIRSTETYVMERQLKLEAGLVTEDGAWGINFGLDANAIPDPMRDDYQWLSVGGNYASDSWWLPGARIGARRNLVGSELTYLTAGVTLFNVLNIDIASTVETISINDKTRPRGLIANIGFNVLF